MSTMEGLSVKPLSGFDRLGARLEEIVIIDETFLYYARQWRQLRLHREQLRNMASRYPLFVEFRRVRVVLESADDVDRLTANIRAKLKELWVNR